MTNGVAGGPNAPVEGWIAKNGVEGGQEGVGSRRREGGGNVGKMDCSKKQENTRRILEEHKQAIGIASASGLRGRGRVVSNELAGREEVRGMPLIAWTCRSPRRWSNGGPGEVRRLDGKPRWRSPRSSEVNRRPRRNRSSAPGGTVDYRSA